MLYLEYRATERSYELICREKKKKRLKEEEFIGVGRVKKALGELSEWVGGGILDDTTALEIPAGRNTARARVGEERHLQPKQVSPSVGQLRGKYRRWFGALALRLPTSRGTSPKPCRASADPAAGRSLFFKGGGGLESAELQINFDRFPLFFFFFFFFFFLPPLLGSSGVTVEQGGDGRWGWLAVV